MTITMNDVVIYNLSTWWATGIIILAMFLMAYGVHRTFKAMKAGTPEKDALKIGRSYGRAGFYLAVLRVIFAWGPAIVLLSI